MEALGVTLSSLDVGVDPDGPAEPPVEPRDPGLRSLPLQPAAPGGVAHVADGARARGG